MIHKCRSFNRSEWLVKAEKMQLSLQKGLVGLTVPEDKSGYRKYHLILCVVHFTKTSHIPLS